MLTLVVGMIGLSFAIFALLRYLSTCYHKWEVTCKTVRPEERWRYQPNIPAKTSVLLTCSYCGKVRQFVLEGTEHP